MACRGLIRRSGRGLLARAVLGALVIAGSAASASVASAAETVVNFDTLKAPEPVTIQYEAQGLKLGFAGEFGQSSPGPEKEGNCGHPTVEEAKSGIKAASPPNYAVLPSCPEAMEPFKGTYGALLGSARSVLSVEVSNLSVGTPAVEVQLVAYNGAGKEVASAHGEATNASWHRIAVAPPGEPQISYFLIRTAKKSTPTIGIDNLAYERQSEPPGPPPKPPPPPPPPSASVSLQTPNPEPGGLVGLSGGGSQAGSGRIISYDWDLNGGGKTTTSTGTNPVVHLVLRPGFHAIGLTVTNSNGEKSSSKFGVTVPTHIELPPPPDGGQGPCEPTLEVGDAQLTAECIQKLSGGGYVIETRQLGLNGMVLKPKGGGYGVFKIHTIKDIAIDGTETLMSGSPVNVELLNTPIGDVVIGGRDLEAEPIQLEAHSALNQFKIPILNHGLHGPRAHAAEGPTKSLLMAIGVGKECTAKEKGAAGCCPPAQGNTACATLPGNFPLVGQVDVYVNNKGQALFDVQVGLALKGIFEATGALEIEAANQTGVNLNSLVFTIPEAGLEGIFTVKKAKFAYYFPSAPDESKRDTWQAEGEVVFGPLGQPSLEAELAFKKGQFHSGSLVFTTPPPGIVIYPGISLNKIGASIAVEPFAFGGVLGAKIAETLQLTLSFKFREATSQELGFFGGQGQLELGEDKIATLAADVYSDGYVDAQLNIDLHLPFSSAKPTVKVGGTIGFWDESKSGLWQAEGSVYLQLWEISAEVAGLVNNKYIAGCLAAGSFGVQGRYSFVDGSVDGGLFGLSNCSDQLKQYQQKPLVKHSGGFVGGESLRFPRIRTAPGAVGGLLGRHGASSAAGLAAAVEGDTFTLPAGQFAQELRFTSSSGTPVVKLIAPGGQIYTTPLAAGHIVTSGEQFIAAVAPDHHQVLVLLKHPKGGVWRVQTAPGSPPLAKLEVAGDTPPASVQVKVKHGHGSSWSLAYKIRNHLPGTSVRFVERGRDSTHVLGTVKGAAGTLRFTPQDAVSRARRIVAYLLNSEGVPVRALTVGRYTAPGAQRGGRVRAVRIARHGLTALVTWGAAPGTRLYRIEVRGSDGRLITAFRKPGSRSVQLTNVLPFESFTATVTAKGGPNLMSGPAASGRLAALKLKPTAKRKTGRRK